MVNSAGFVISEEEDLTLGPGPGLITQEFCVAEFYQRLKRNKESL